MSRSRLLALAGVLWAVVVPAASARNEGVFVDPDSPTGKEYAIPLEEARQKASGETAPERSSGGESGRSAAAPLPQSAPLFGAGIRRPKEAHRRGRRAGDEGRGTDSRAPGPSTTAAIAGDDGSPVVASGGIALGVLLLGGAFGFVLRRGPKRS